MLWDVDVWLLVQVVFICFPGGKSKLSIGGLFLINYKGNGEERQNSTAWNKPQSHY